jgi:signal transduction histidine kinase
LELKFRAVPIGEILERAVGMVPPAPGVQVEIAVPAASMVVRADPDQLTRLFVNLLENALRHTPAGGQVVLAAWLEDELEGGGVVAQVRDTGEGIAPEDLPLVTQRFYRADPSRSRGSRNGGTGLGLAICYTIAMAHGRPLRIESELGKGTTVTVHLEAQPPALS